MPDQHRSEHLRDQMAAQHGTGQHPAVSAFTRAWRITTVYIAIAVSLILLILIADVAGLLPEIRTHITTERK